MTGTAGMRKRKAWRVAAALLLFLASLGTAFFLSLSRETLLRFASSEAARASFSIRALSASTRFPATVRFDNVTLLREGSNLPFQADRAELGIHPLGLLFGAPLRVTLSRGGAILESGSTLSFSRGKVVGKGLSSADLSIPPSSGFSFLLDRGEGTWRRTATGGDGVGTLRFRELRLPLPKGQGPVEEAILRDVTLKYVLAGPNLRVSSLSGAYEDTTVEGSGEIVSLFGRGEATVTAAFRVVNPLSGRVASLFDMASRNARNATFHLSGALRSPKGELQLF